MSFCVCSDKGKLKLSFTFLVITLSENWGYTSRKENGSVSFSDGK